MRKKSKYKPRPVILDTMNWVRNGFRPLNDVGDEAIKLRLKYHTALEALISGDAAKVDIQTLIHAANMTMALKRHGFGSEYQDISMAGTCAVEAVKNRLERWGKVQATAKELEQIKAMMELHDAQLDIVRINDLEQAIKTVKKKEAIAV